MRANPTRAESYLWGKLSGQKLCGLRFSRQVLLEGYIADFYCPAAGLVVEIDGPSHIGRECYDARRDRHMEHAGLTVLRFSNQELFRNTGWVLKSIAATAKCLIEGAVK